MPSKQPEISVVILCYRAEEYVRLFVTEIKEVLRKRGLHFELVLVANYKAKLKGIDKTPQIVADIASNDSTIVVVAEEKRGMMGWDMRAGFKAASGRTIAVIDGDGQMPAADVIKVYNALTSWPDYDLAKTYRDQRFDGFSRLAFSIFYNLFLDILFPGVKTRDVNSKPKIFKREALEKLHLASDDWFIDSEIIIKATKLNMSIVDVPTKFYVNANRRSFIKFSTIFEFVKNLFYYRIKYWFIPISKL